MQVPGVLEVYHELKGSLFASDCTWSITCITLTGCDDDTYQDIDEAIKDLPVPSGLEVQVSSMQLMTKSVLEGISKTMDLSTLT